MRAGGGARDGSGGLGGRGAQLGDDVVDLGAAQLRAGADEAAGDLGGEVEVDEVDDGPAPELDVRTTVVDSGAKLTHPRPVPDRLVTACVHARTVRGGGPCAGPGTR